MAITLMLSMSANANDSEGASVTEKRAILSGVFIVAVSLVSHPLTPVIVVASLDAAMKLDLPPGRRYKRHTKGGR